MTANRFDHLEWSNYNYDCESLGFVVPEKKGSSDSRPELKKPEENPLAINGIKMGSTNGFGIDKFNINNLGNSNKNSLGFVLGGK